MSYRNNRERSETQATQLHKEDTGHDWIHRVFEHSDVTGRKKLMMPTFVLRILSDLETSALNVINHSHFQAADSYCTGENFCRSSRNPDFYYRLHKSMTFFRDTLYKNSLSHTVALRATLILSCLRLSPSNYPFPSDFPTRNFRDKCSVPIIFLYFIIMIIFDVNLKTLKLVKKVFLRYVQTLFPTWKLNLYSALICDLFSFIHENKHRRNFYTIACV
jgi:hypothetical protein